MKHIKQHLIFISVLIALLTLLGFVLAGCDEMQVVDVIIDSPTDTRPYTRAPSLDITLDIPDDLKFKVPVFTGNGHRRFSDISHTLSQRRLAMTKDRIYVPTGSGENIYVFDYSGTLLPDETLTRPAIHSMHSSLPSITEHKQSGDSLAAILTDGEYLYLFIVVDIFGGVWLDQLMVRIHIANNFAYPPQDWSNLGIAPLMINDRLYFKRKMGHRSIEYWHKNRPDVLVRYDKITLEPIPEHNIEIQHGHKLNWQLNDGSLPQSEWNFSVSGIHVDRHIDNVFNGAYITADATHIYLGASLGIYSGFTLDGAHDPTLDIDINGVVEYSPYGQAGLVNAGDRMYLPGSNGEGAVDADGNMEIKLFAFTK